MSYTALELRGNLTVKVEGARNMDSRDITGHMDPYCKLTLHKQKHKTTVKTKAGGTCSWNETFHFEIGGEDVKEQILHVDVYDKDLLSDDHIGRLDCPVAYLLRYQAPHEYQLVHRENFKKITGYITLQCSFTGEGLPSNYAEDGVYASKPPPVTYDTPKPTIPTPTTTIIPPSYSRPTSYIPSSPTPSVSLSGGGGYMMPGYDRAQTTVMMSPPASYPGYDRAPTVQYDPRSYPGYYGTGGQLLQGPSPQMSSSPMADRYLASKSTPPTGEGFSMSVTPPSSIPTPSAPTSYEGPTLTFTSPPPRSPTTVMGSDPSSLGVPGSERPTTPVSPTTPTSPTSPVGQLTTTSSPASPSQLEPTFVRPLSVSPSIPSPSSSTYAQPMSRVQGSTTTTSIGPTISPPPSSPSPTPFSSNLTYPPTYASPAPSYPGYPGTTVYQSPYPGQQQPVYQQPYQPQPQYGYSPYPQPYAQPLTSQYPGYAQPYYQPQPQGGQQAYYQQPYQQSFPSTTTPSTSTTPPPSSFSYQPSYTVQRTTPTQYERR